MVAPEKIYLTKSLLGVLHDDWNAQPSEVFTNIEYTRTDVFIEKAVTWLMDNIQDYTDDGMGEHSFVLVQDLKEHFKNYMKGE